MKTVSFDLADTTYNAIVHRCNSYGLDLNKTLQSYFLSGYLGLGFNYAYAYASCIDKVDKLIEEFKVMEKEFKK